MAKMYIRSVLVVCICALFSQGCNVINPAEKVPTYIHVDSFRVNANAFFPNISRSSQITSVWAYYNNNPIGTFDLPATIPVMTTGSDTGVGGLQLAAGVAVDGLNNLLGVYPFYELDTFSFRPQPGKILVHEAQTSYFNDAKITSISNFEGPLNFSLQSGNIPMIKVTQLSDPSAVFEGFGSGSITLHNVGDSSVDSSITAFAIPLGSSFIELNYKSEIPFYLGLQANLSTIAQSTPFFIAGINPSATWQKFYLSVADFNVQYKGTSYTLYIKAVLLPGQSSGQLLLDNIQLVTF